MKFIFFVLISALLLHAQPKTKNNPYFIPGMDVAKDDFYKFIKHESPKTFCDDTSYFIKCFDVVPAQCPNETKSSVDECKKILKIPSKFDVLDVDQYASLLGDCVGVDLEKKWSERKRGSRECKKRF